MAWQSHGCNLQLLVSVGLPRHPWVQSFLPSGNQLWPMVLSMAWILTRPLAVWNRTMVRTSVKLLCVLGGLVFCLQSAAQAQEAPKKNARVLMLTHSAGFKHGS